MKTATVPVKLLVTDVGAKVLDADIDRADLSEKVREAIRWEEARMVQICDFTIEVNLLEPPEKTIDPVPASRQIPEDLQKLIEQEMAKRKKELRDEAWDILMDAFPAGKYQIYKEGGVRGMKRIDD